LKTSIAITLPLVNRLNKRGNWVSRLATALNSTGKRRIHEAIGRRFLRLTWETFGANGKNRAHQWRPLTLRYMAEINYFGAPKLILKGNLINDIRMDSATASTTTVTAHTEYASEHQHGTRVIPPRPFFPMLAGKLTPHAERELVKAGQDELGKLLR
jgi:phage gpG-like protein